MDMRLILDGYPERFRSAIRMRRHRKAEEDKFPARQRGRLITDQPLDRKEKGKNNFPHGTKIARKRLKIYGILDTDNKLIGPGPRVVNESGQYYEVERIIGASAVCGYRSFLIKWMGWPMDCCTWEPETALWNADRAKEMFFATYGTPSCHTRVILSSEGERFEKWKQLRSTGVQNRISIIRMYSKWLSSA
ncbi:uncharacterized protein LOC129582038 [Paramacrobiotus metropolitanus]|uniref:uncharacterized protein LOC129582038 n=1 Tax=Paramacrobiotus metropolitanus TaxID=2943436 RepID=UPI0024459B78|nr:uncharacterized protein LOC129582038 [Paramacrobiotus metropolitanus]